jgi:polyisoprenoid-binding protein YceI
MVKNLLVMALALTSLSALAKVETLQVDPAASKLTYTGKKVTGQHSGEVKIAKGSLSFDGKALKGGEIEVDMTTITNTDIGDPEYMKKFIGHITSGDFFDTANFKTATLKVKSVKKGKATDSFSVTADLTIKGKTAPVTFDATATKEKANAKLVFDRTKYDVKYNSGKFFQGLGDKMIYDDVELEVNLSLKK